MSSFALTPKLGSRISDSDGFLGTVLYIGPVASAKNQSEVYAGIEWDDDTRGKHDGSVISRADKSIVRHFKCESSSATAGSFVKSSKLNLGIDFCTTLAERYVTVDAPLLAPGNKFEGCVAMTKKGRSKQIEVRHRNELLGQVLQDKCCRTSVAGQVLKTRTQTLMCRTALPVLENITHPIPFSLTRLRKR